jgi:type IV pilus assembly protein PilE
VSKQGGVTLIELLIVVVIVSILSSVAVGSYRRFTLRANRGDATSTLLQVRVEQEKFFLQNRRYASSVAEITAAPPNGLGIPLGAFGSTTGGKYSITINSPTATTYTVTATTMGGQTQDTAACQIFTLNESGQRTPAVASGCWR